MMPTDSKPKTKKNGLALTILAAGFFALIALFLNRLLTQSTAEFREFGILGSLISTITVALFLIPLTFIVGLTVSPIQRPAWFTRRVFVGIGVGSVLSAGLFGLYESSPTTRLLRATQGTEVNATNVQVVGFNSFLANRWLYSFDATEEEVTSIASALLLEPSDDINLKVSLEQDIFFQKREFPLMAGIPGKNASLAFRNSKQKGHASGWTTLVFSASAKRA